MTRSLLLLFVKQKTDEYILNKYRLSGILRQKIGYLRKLVPALIASVNKI